MAYSVRYGTVQDLKRYEGEQAPNWGLLVLAFAMALIIGIRVFMPKVYNFAVATISPWDETAERAFQLMVENVSEGQPVGEAVDAFCRSIIGYGQFSR